MEIIYVILIILYILIICFCSFCLLFMLLPIFFWGAVYVPTRVETVKRIINILDIKPGEKVADLGSGDGRLVIALAKAGAEAYGYEINPFLFLLSRKNIKKAGLKGKAFIHLKSFWNEDLSQFDAISVYGISYIMDKLEKKLKKELKNNSRVACNRFNFHNWRYFKKEEEIYLYKI